MNLDISSSIGHHLSIASYSKVCCKYRKWHYSLIRKKVTKKDIGDVDLFPTNKKS